MIFVIAPFVLLVSGCAKIAHLDELLRLKNYSAEKEREKKFVEGQDKNFERLLAAVKGQGLGRYPDQKSILKEFGEPVFGRKTVKADIPCEVWLYRYATQYFGSDKVYLYFDQKGKLKSYDYLPSG